MLPKQHRVTRGADYRRIVKRGRRSGSSTMLVYTVSKPSHEAARFGFIVAKPVGKAHVRNTVRRRLKAASYELIRQGLSGVDVVVRAHPESAQSSWSELRAALHEAVSRSQIGSTK